MRIRTQLRVNGAYVVETCSWDELHDGVFQIRLSPSAVRALGHPDVRLEIRVENIATVESLETRVKALERAIDASHILSRAAQL